MIYILDTSSLMVLRSYFPALFPSVWKNIDQLVFEGRLRSVKEVKRELEARDSQHVSDWVKENGELFAAPTVQDLKNVTEIFKVKHFEQLVGEKQRLLGLPVADPFLVAAAISVEGCVVTEEKFKDNAAKIPNACKHFEVECTSIEGMMKSEGWKF